MYRYKNNISLFTICYTSHIYIHIIYICGTCGLVLLYSRFLAGIGGGWDPNLPRPDQMPSSFIVFL